MFQHILIPTDGSLLSDSALDRGLSLARASGARVTVVAVTEPFVVLSAEARKIGVSQADHEREVKAAAAGHLAQAARKAAAIGVACETIEVENEHPYRGIIETATERQCDLITMASHARRGITALVLNSETVNVMTHSAIPLLVYR
ncbi:universal stress protein [Reyranella sp.]|uniref:universal stress protein n=1 Tax=Reyranella sp. TaxID=1929291 RepID=UPI002731E208|nr:universal stress protein [Reyranella sp.]MDP2376072.1 universal stress protein [Reyranella sp.]